MTEWTVNNKLNDWYQKQYHIKLPKKYETKSRLYFSTAPVSSFSPIDLFATGSQGIWLDPSDLSTMFSDRAGTTPVTTPGTVVGLRLDKSKGLVLGAELADTINTVAPWLIYGANTVTQTTNGIIIQGVNDGRYAITNLKASDGLSENLVVGKTYDLTFTAFTSSSTASILTANAGTNSAAITSTPQFFRIRISPINAFASLGFTAVSSTLTITVTNISVRELPGNHAVAPTDAARPIYGVEPKGGRRNLVIQSESFDNAAWVKGSGSITATNIVDPIGGSTAEAFTCSASGGILYSTTPVAVQSGGTYVASLWMKVPSGTDTIALTIMNPSAVVLQTVNCSVTTSWQRFTVSGSVGANTTVLFTIGGSSTISTGEIVHLWGAQLELGSTATNYQRVTTAYDITESGVATCHYVQYDGSDDSMSTSAIDFTATDKMSVFAGVRKLSDAAVGMLAELSAGAGDGRFLFTAPPGAGSPQYAFTSAGTISSAVASGAGFAAPITNVLTGTGDISGDRTTLRINGTQVAQTTTDQGTGNYGNYPIYLGRRGGTTLPFYGRDYGIVVVGKATTADEITSTERWLSGKTGFYAPVITGVPTIGVS